MNPEIRKRVFERDKHTCRYCGDKNGPFHADHVYPSSKGGETSIENLVTACARCNRKKQAKVGLWPRPIGYFDPVPFNWLLWIIMTNAIMALMILSAILAK